MSNYLFELELTVIPSGWDKIYKEASEIYPNGQIVNHGNESSYFFDPVSCRHLVIKEFEKHKALAKKLFTEQSLSTKQAINNFVETDIILYNLLDLWVSDDHDYFSFDPRSFIDDIFQEKFSYFSAYTPSYLKPYKKFRFLEIDFDL